jgi:O-antigen/teichoic acid export membrane protein
VRGRVSTITRFIPGVRSTRFAWGFASQSASSATNFGLSWLAGRLTGPRGLGIVFIGFSYYLLAWAMQRALITNPLVAKSSLLEEESRTSASRAALTSAILFGLASTIALLSVALLVSGDAGRGLLLFTPWLAPALLQDVWRVMLFRDGRNRAGALNDASWLLTMVVTTPVAVAAKDNWVIVSVWGLGALVGCLLGFFQTRLVPSRPADALGWWRQSAWPFGRWLGAESIVYALGSQSLVFLLAAIVDTRAIGGLRAVTAVFGPLTVLGPALALPGVPELAKRAAVSVPAAMSLAVRIGAAATILTGAYVVLIAIGGERLLTTVFGHSFGNYGALVWPIGLGQVLLAPTIGFALLLRAQAKGAALLTGRLIGSIATLGLSLGFAVTWGILGAAWGMALGAVVGGAAIAWLTLRHHPNQGSHRDTEYVQEWPLTARTTTHEQ